MAAAAAVSNGTPAYSFPRPVTVLSDGPVQTKTTESVLEILEHLLSTGKDELPKEMIVSEVDRSTISHDEWHDLTEIPVIDLSLVQTDRAGVLKQIHTAVTEWGFFQTVNHGISLEVLKGAQSQGRKFFDLPVKVKERAELPDEGLSPYSGDNSKRNVSSLFWAESLSIELDYLDKIVNRVWPDGNQEFMDAVTKLNSGAEMVSKQLLELIAESLGLPTEFFAQHFDRETTSGNFNPFRFNFYPACPKPMDSLGATSHTDPNCITLLLQDKVGGLQIEKDGKWIGIRPIEDALVVNIGDTLHVWTNGICRSVLHRVVVNKDVSRLSIAAFRSVDGRLPISPPEKLVDDNNPRQYKDLTPVEYVSFLTKSRNQDTRTVRNGVAFLKEHFKFEE